MENDDLRSALRSSAHNDRRLGGVYDNTNNATTTIIIILYYIVTET